MSSPLNTARRLSAFREEVRKYFKTMHTPPSSEKVRQAQGMATRPDPDVFKGWERNMAIGMIAEEEAKYAK
jgi:hypothetical protein